MANIKDAVYDPVYNAVYDIGNKKGHVPAFKITVDTTKAGSASDTFVLPLDGSSTYNFDVDWGDGSKETVTTNTDVTHQYTTSGMYQIAITGVFPHIYFNNSGDKLKLMSIDNWGDIVWQSMLYAFYSCSNVYGTYIDSPDFSSVTDVKAMFRGCSSFNQSVSNFDTSSVTDMRYMLDGCSSFNQSVSNFDTSSVTSMRYMFYGCSSFKQDISGFSIQSVTDLSNMLSGCDINEVGTTTNYDDLLVSFESQANTYSKTGLSFHGGSSQYSTTGETARNSLVNTYNWIITDGGLI